MIQSIGIDSVEIDRFAQWHAYDKKLLLKVFHPQEVAYCLSNTTKSAERFAVRFALKEAFYKAFTQLGLRKALSLITVCKNVYITTSDQNIPQLNVDWHILHPYATADMLIHNIKFSLTHSKATATAVIIFE